MGQYHRSVTKKMLLLSDVDAHYEVRYRLHSESPEGSTIHLHNTHTVQNA